MKRFRRNAEYAIDLRIFRSIDRNQRIRIITTAEALERRTKAKGQKSGVLGLSGLELLRCLLLPVLRDPDRPVLSELPGNPGDDRLLLQHHLRSFEAP